MAYGTVDDVAALVPQYTDSGSFTVTTQPTSTQVQTWLDRVSAIMDVELASRGIVVPVTATTPLLAITQFVVEEVARLAEDSHRAGPFTTGENTVQRPRFDRTMRRVRDWLDENMAGLVRTGAELSAAAKRVAWGEGDKVPWKDSMLEQPFDGESTT